MDEAKILSSGKGMTLPQTCPGFYCLQNKSFENTMGKAEIAHSDKILSQQLTHDRSYISQQLTYDRSYIH